MRLDKHSLAQIQKSIFKIKDELTRIVIWHSLFQMVQDAEFLALDYVDLACEAVDLEPNDIILDLIFADLKTVVTEFLPIKLRDLVNGKIFSKIYRKLVQNKPKNSSEAIIHRRELVNYASNEDNYKVLLNWLLDKDPLLPASRLSVKDKWLLLRSYSVLRPFQRRNNPGL